MPKLAGWNKVKNILCVRLDNMGDVLMTSPAFRALKSAVSGRNLTLLTSSAGEKIGKLLPELDEVIVFNSPWSKMGAKPEIEQVSEIIEELKRRNFDGAVIFNVYSQNPLPAAMMCYMAGIPKIAGFCRENPYGLMSHWIPDKEPLYVIKHEVTRQLDLVKTLGAKAVSTDLSVPVIKSTDIKSAFRKLEEEGVDPEKPFIIVHPGVSEKKRQCNPEIFAETIKRISKDLKVQIVITGVAEEKPIADSILEQSAYNACSVAGKFTLEELIAVISKADAVISNNSGPAHLAAALKTPVVVLYALTNPQHAPWNVRHRIIPFNVPLSARSKNVLIQFAGDKCFLAEPDQMKPEHILSALNQVLNKSSNKEKTELLLL